jgi:hypothetical protein
MLFVGTALVLAGCAAPPGPRPGPPGPPAARLGTLTVVDDTVRINGRAVRGSVPLSEGDAVETSGNGRARVDIPGRGTVDLGSRFSFVRDGACVLVRILLGQALVSGHGFCVEDPDGTRLVLNSTVHVSVSPAATVVTVIEGNVQLARVARAPSVVTLAPLERVTIASRTVQRRERVPPSEVERIRRLRIVPPAVTPAPRTQPVR